MLFYLLGGIEEQSGSPDTAPFRPSEGAVGNASGVVCGCESLPGMAEGQGCISVRVSCFQPAMAKSNPPTTAAIH